MALYDPTQPPKSLQDVLAAAPPETSVSGVTRLLTADYKTVEVQGLPFAQPTPAERAADGDVTLVVGYTLAGGGYDSTTLAKIAAKQTAGWPNYAILVRVMGTSTGVEPEAGSISAVSVSLRPTVSAPSLVGVRIGSISAASVSSRPVIATATMAGTQTGSIAAAAVSLQPSVSVGTLLGIQEGVGVIGVASVSLCPAVSAPSLTGVTTGSIAAAVVTMQPSVEAGIIYSGDEAPVSVTLTPAPGAVVIFTLDGSAPMDYIVTSDGTAVFSNGELVTTGDVQ